MICTLALFYAMTCLSFPYMMQQKTRAIFAVLKAKLLINLVGVGNSRVNPRFHLTNIGLNLGLTQKFQPLTGLIDWVNCRVHTASPPPNSMPFQCLFKTHDPFSRPDRNQHVMVFLHILYSLKRYAHALVLYIFAYRSHSHISRTHKHSPTFRNCCPLTCIIFLSLIEVTPLVSTSFYGNTRCQIQSLSD